MPARKIISASRKVIPSSIILSAIIVVFLSNSCTREGDDRAENARSGGGAAQSAQSTDPASVKPVPVKEIKREADSEFTLSAAKGLLLLRSEGAGKLVYERHCHYCHGMTGRGDGSVGIALTPHPVNFVDDSKSMAKSDAILFKSITEGISRDVGGKNMFMPRWKEILSEKERWDVLAYIRKLSEDGRKKNK